MRMIPFIVPQIELIGLNDFLKAFVSRQWAEGPEIHQLEGRIAQFVGVRHAVVFASGRYSLYLLYNYFGCCGKKVIVPAYTCIPAADAFRWAGAEPFFVDIDVESYNPLYEPCVEKVKDVGAVCLSYLYGLVADPMPFLDWARAAGIPVIEDAAIALGGKVHGRMVGSIGDAAVFSLQSSKIITGWRGGVITTDDTELYEFLRQHQKQQPHPSFFKVLMNGCLMAVRRLLADSSVYGSTMYPVRQATLHPRFARFLERFLDENPSEAVRGSNYKYLPSVERCSFTNPQAKLALASIDKLDEILALRRTYADYLTAGLKEIPGVVIPASHDGIEHAYGRFPIRIEGLNKGYAVEAFARLNIEIGLNYPYIIPDTQYFRGYSNSNRNFPNARKASEETILLPFHTCLRKQSLDHIVAAVRHVARETRNQVS